MRRFFATGAALILASCSSPEPVGRPAADEPLKPGSAAPAPTPSSAMQPGGGLHGEVSGLSGEVTDFRVEQTATSTIVEIASDVLFAFDSADLSAAAPAQLNRAADVIRQGGPGPIEVRGHTDAKGDIAYNLGLSERRAASGGLGETDPVAPNARPDGTDDPAGRALNRRVTIVIPKA